MLHAPGIVLHACLTLTCGHDGLWLLQSHQYVRDVETAVSSASAWFNSHYPDGAQNKDLCVFDIDETVLSNFNVSPSAQKSPPPLGPCSKNKIGEVTSRPSRRSRVVERVLYSKNGLGSVRV